MREFRDISENYKYWYYRWKIPSTTELLDILKTLLFWVYVWKFCDRQNFPPSCWLFWNNMELPHTEKFHLSKTFTDFYYFAYLIFLHSEVPARWKPLYIGQLGLCWSSGASSCIALLCQLVNIFFLCICFLIEFSQIWFHEYITSSQMIWL